MKILHLGLCANGLDNLNGVQKSLIKYSTEYRELATGDPDFNTKSVEMAEAMKPDIIFMQIQNATVITVDCAKKLKATGAWVCNWTGDVRSPLPQWYIDIGKVIDITLFTNLNDVTTMLEMGINADYLDIGFDPEVFFPDERELKDFDISFLGNNYGVKFPLSEFRRGIAAHMEVAFGSNFHLYGNGWTNSRGSMNHSQEEEANFYRRNKIAINCSHFDYIRYSSDRMLRIMGCGVLCMTKWYPGLEADYEDGHNVVVWRTLSELEEKCKYYLYHEEERQKIAKEGWRHINKIRTFDVMIEGLLEIYKKR